MYDLKMPPASDQHARVHRYGKFIVHHFYQCNRRDFTRLEEVGTVRYRQSPIGCKDRGGKELIHLPMAAHALTVQPFIGLYIELVNLILFRYVFDVVGR